MVIQQMKGKSESNGKTTLNLRLITPDQLQYFHH